MRFDNGIELEKQVIDITPLIDVVFLLVMFFAVSSSFISGKDLQALRSKLSGLISTQSGLEAKLEGSIDARGNLQRQLQAEELERQELLAQLDKLERQLADHARAESLLRDRLTESEGELAITVARSSELAATNADSQDRLSALQGRLASRELELKSAREAAASEMQLLSDRLNAALASIDRLNRRLATRESAFLSSEGRVKELESELSNYRQSADDDRRMLEKAARAQELFSDQMNDFLGKDSIGVVRDELKVTLQLADKILFASGSPDIKPEGLPVLQQLGELIAQQIDGVDVFVGGHTDNVPVSASRSGSYDNWGLSAERAVNVVRFLEQESGIAPEIMAAVGYGEFRPIDDNANAEGRSRNRRIEIVLLPR